jgi:hypothetical protein
VRAYPERDHAHGEQRALAGEAGPRTKCRNHGGNIDAS